MVFFEPDIDLNDASRNLKLEIKYAILFISFIYAFNSFSSNNLFVYFSILPFNVSILSFIHGIFEIPAMIIPSVMSFYIVDSIYEINEEKNKEIQKTEIQKLITKSIAVICIFSFILLIAAYVECYITPNIIRQQFENYLLNR